MRWRKGIIMIVSKVTSKGQVTIPKKVRDFLKIDVSDRIEFTLLEEGKVLLTNESVSAKSLFGLLNHRKKSDVVSPEEMDAAIREKRIRRYIS